MRRLARWLVAPAFAVASACASALPVLGQVETLTLEVAPDSIACVGEMTGRCLQVRSPGQKDWRTFFDPIEGFRHEPGVRYTLKVARRKVSQPPADGSAYVYAVLEVLAREPPAG